MPAALSGSGRRRKEPVQFSLAAGIVTEHPKIAAPPVPFIDLQAQRKRLGTRLDEAIARVLAHGQFIMGPEVFALEADLARYCGAREVITCASGTDALALVILAKGVKAGEAVLCPSFTFAATAEFVVSVGATPVFVDIDAETFNVDPASVERGIATAKQRGLKPVGLIPVDLFGQTADYDAIEPICARHGLWILSDSAQSFGASYRGRKVGTIGAATATSFYPAKPLGCYGDGGAVFTDDPTLANVMRSLRIHGQGEDKYDNVRIGMNGRLDTLQAAILIEKLKILSDEIERRNIVAERYNAGLRDVVETPRVLDGATSAWAQYTIKVPRRRDELVAALKRRGIPTAIHYPKAVHMQTAYRDFPLAANGLPVSERLVEEVVSLPMHPYLDEPVQDRIIAAVKEALR